MPSPASEGDVLDIRRSSPSDGTIKVGLSASGDLKVGDTIEVRATLSGPDGDLVEKVLVRISDPELKVIEPKPEALPPLGIPELVLCTRTGLNDTKSWNDINEAGIDMSHDVVVYPFVEDDKLSQIYVNLDSKILLDFKRNVNSEEGNQLAERRYISSVYFHTLFLFATAKSRKYDVRKTNGEETTEVDLGEFIADIFSSNYAQFLLNFDTGDLMETMS